MEWKPSSKVFQVKGMSCPSCEIKIENVLRKIEGVIKVNASLAKSQVTVEYDLAKVDIEKLAAAITKLGYEVGGNEAGKNKKKKSINQLLGIGIIIFALYFTFQSTVGFNFL
jgi:copper ion binding protein